MTVEWHELSDYLAGETDPARDEELERTLFEDPGAAAAVGSFLACVDGIAEIRRRHCSLSGALTPEALDELRGHTELLEIEIENGQIAGCRIPATAAICVAHLRVDLTGTTHADIEYCNAQGVVYFASRDVHLDRESNRILIACERHLALREEVSIFRVVAIGPERRVLGEFGVRNLPPLS